MDELNNKSRQPCISVIIPVYNVEHYVRKCLQSVSDQQHGNLQILVVDDGSEDRSGDICREVAEHDSRITIITQENLGLSGARNTALDMAHGAYIAFVDSDDWVEPDMLRRLLEAIEHTGSDIAVCAYTLRKGDRSSVLGQAPEKCMTRDEAVRHLFSDVWLHNFVWNKLYRRELFEGIRFPLGVKFEDIPVMYRLFLRARQLAFVNHPGYNYRVRPGSIIGKQQFDTELDACENHIIRYHYIERHHPELISLLWRPLIRCLMHTIYIGVQNPRAVQRKCRKRRTSITNFLQEHREQAAVALSWPECVIRHLVCRSTWGADIVVAGCAIVAKVACRIRQRFASSSHKLWESISTEKGK